MSNFTFSLVPINRFSRILTLGGQFHSNLGSTGTFSTPDAMTASHGYWVVEL